jgi:hypothetical protein
MKSLLKNRRCYKQRIGSSDQYNDGEGLEEGKELEKDGEESEKDGEELEKDSEELENEEGEDSEEEESEKENESEKEKEGNDDNWESVYMPETIDENGIGKDGNGNEGGNSADEDDLQAFGGNDDGEGSRSVERTAATGLASTRKRKVTQDDELATTTRAAGKRKKVDSSGGDQVASRSAPSTKKALPKRRK